MVEKTDKNTTFVINETKRPNSIEIGKAGNRVKLYFGTAKDLQDQITALEETGAWKREQ